MSKKKKFKIAIRFLRAVRLCSWKYDDEDGVHIPTRLYGDIDTFLKRIDKIEKKGRKAL